MQTQSVVINFTGGIVSPGYLKEILEVAQQSGVAHVRFGLRQQLIMEVPVKHFESFNKSCRAKNSIADKAKEALPNIVSSYPAAGIFTSDSWLREGVYKDIFDLFNYQPQLKINICDSQQCLVPFFTGHINWVTSFSEHFWLLYIRFPKTNTIYKWKDLVYTNDLALVSKKIEQEIRNDEFLFYGNSNADGNLLYQRVKQLTAYVHKPSVEEQAIDFSLPYYEGFNKTNNQLWLGIYRRDEQFPVGFLLEVCNICLDTRIGQLYTTPWKTIIIKSIDAGSRKLWDHVLGKYRVNVRHAANELNWQVEDFSEEGLQLKRHIIRYFDKEDVRTYGLCFAVQTKPSSSLFGTIVIQKQQTKNPHRLKSLERYDILYRRRFNPNEGETMLFREGVEKEHLGVYLVSLCKFFYEQSSGENNMEANTQIEKPVIAETRKVYQCKHCYTVYDPLIGDEQQNVAAGTGFEQLPSTYSCSLCESGKEDFAEVDETVLTTV
jgi:rubredoxin